MEPIVLPNITHAATFTALQSVGIFATADSAKLMRHRDLAAIIGTCDPLLAFEIVCAMYAKDTVAGSRLNELMQEIIKRYLNDAIAQHTGWFVTVSMAFSGLHSTADLVIQADLPSVTQMGILRPTAKRGSVIYSLKTAVGEMIACFFATASAPLIK